MNEMLIVAVACGAAGTMSRKLVICHVAKRLRVGLGLGARWRRWIDQVRRIGRWRKRWRRADNARRGRDRITDQRNAVLLAATNASDVLEARETILKAA